MVYVGFLQVLWFPPSSQRHASSQNSYAKLPLGVWCPAMDCCLTQGGFPPHALCSQDTLWIFEFDQNYIKPTRSVNEYEKFI